MRILLIEDDKLVATLVEEALKKKGYAVDLAENGKDGYELARINDESYSVIIVDIMLPELSGFEIIEKLREDGNQTPMLILSSRDATEDKVKGLNIGGDDYLTKPFKVTELVARIKALERRRDGNSVEKKLKVRSVVLDPVSHEVIVDDEIIDLTRLEFRLLYLLMQAKGKLVSREEILERVWDLNGESLLSNSINVHIKNLRKKIKEDKENPLIITIRGAGYKFAKE